MRNTDGPYWRYLALVSDLSDDRISHTVVGADSYYRLGKLVADLKAREDLHASRIHGGSKLAWRYRFSERVLTIEQAREKFESRGNYAIQ